METMKDKTVAEIVTQNIKTADIFKKHGIDFCCGGGISVAKACEKHNIDLTEIENELSALGNVAPTAQNYNDWGLDYLSDYIVNTHHGYVAEAIPLLLHYASRVAQVHGEHYKEVVTINNLVREVAQELAAHMKKEEIMLFPYIKRLIAEKNGATFQGNPPFESVESPIKMMEAEHESAGDIFKKIFELTNNYTPPQGACNTFKALYNKLDEFEQDLHQHVHLENNILFPKAILLEKELSK